MVLEINKNQCLKVQWVSIFIDFHWLLFINIDFYWSWNLYLFLIKCAIWINKPFTELYLLCFMLLHIECLKFVAFPHQHRSGTSEVRKTSVLWQSRGTDLNTGTSAVELSWTHNTPVIYDASPWIIIDYYWLYWLQSMIDFHWLISPGKSVKCHNKAQSTPVIPDRVR